MMVVVDVNIVFKLHDELILRFSFANKAKYFGCNLRSFSIYL
jgi:hypothetical protein